MYFSSRHIEFFVDDRAARQGSHQDPSPCRRQGAFQLVARNMTLCTAIAPGLLSLCVLLNSSTRMSPLFCFVMQHSKH
jgi:hypothetical protein